MSHLLLQWIWTSFMSSSFTGFLGWTIWSQTGNSKFQRSSWLAKPDRTKKTVIDSNGQIDRSFYCHKSLWPNGTLTIYMSSDTKLYSCRYRFMCSDVDALHNWSREPRRILILESTTLMVKWNEYQNVSPAIVNWSALWFFNLNGASPCPLASMDFTVFTIQLN